MDYSRCEFQHQRPFFIAELHLRLVATARRNPGRLAARRELRARDGRSTSTASLSRTRQLDTWFIPMRSKGAAEVRSISSTRTEDDDAFIMRVTTLASPCGTYPRLQTRLTCSTTQRLGTVSTLDPRTHRQATGRRLRGRNIM